MRQITNSIKNLWSKFGDRDYREGFVDGWVDDSLAIQLQTMRLDRGWTQQQMADRTGTKQAGVCRWESSKPPGSLSTLRKIARAFDVALVVKFVPYSSFLIGDGEAVDAAVPDFDRDFLPQPMSYKALAGVSSNHVRRFDVKDHQRARANAIPIGTSTNFDYRIAS